MNTAADAYGWVQDISLNPPSLTDNTADAERLSNALKARLHTDRVEIDISLLKQLPGLLRKWSYRVRCVIFKADGRWRLLRVLDPFKRMPICGLAIDLGTSRIAMRLLDLESDRVLAESDVDNPQITVGPDILARIHAAETEDGLGRLRQLVQEGVNLEIMGICEKCARLPTDIHLISLAGNTTMTHLFMGLDPRWMIREPYIPVVNKPGCQDAVELGLRVNPAAMVFIFPNIGSYFGGDVFAGILSSGLHALKKTAILVDVGTNAEVVLGNQDWLIGCAGAAGPALEGGVTRMGMMAGPGVVDRVIIDPRTKAIRIHTIDGKPPKGICGSGVIDLAAQMFLAGMIDIRGKLIAPRCGKRLKVTEGIDHFVVVPAEDSATGADLSISQADLDSLVRSKAAMYTILCTVASSVGISLKDLPLFHVAGTFGSFINPVSAVTIGMLPDLPLSRYKPLGNSSLGGAALILRSSRYLEEVDTIRDRTTYLELNVNQEFMNRFSAAKFIPHTDRSRFPSVPFPSGN